MYKLWKRVLSIILTLSTLLCLLPPTITASGSGYGSADDNAWGDEPTKYTIELENGVVLTYTDAGSITKCVLNGNSTVDIPGSVGTITLQKISSAFSNLVDLKAVTIPDTITIISGAFEGCTGLTEIVLPDSVRKMGIWSFQNCTALRSVRLSNQLEGMGYRAFENCTALTAIDLPNSLTEIDEECFLSCGLTSIVIPSNVTTLGTGAFRNCANLSTAVFMNKETSIGANAFAGTSADLTIYGYTGSTAESYANSNKIPFVALDGENRTLTVAVCDPTGAMLSSGYQVCWFDSNDELVSQNKVFYGASAKSEYSCVIALDESLSMQYKTPDAITITPDDNAQLQVTLEPARKLNLSGRVTDTEGTPLADAEVTLEHLISDAAVTVKTDESGSFRVEFPAEKVMLRIGKNGYYTSQTLLDLSEAEDDYDAGTLKLRAVVADRISLSVLQTPAVKAGEEAVSSEWTALERLGITVSRENGEIITDFEIQGNNLIFLPDVVTGGEKLTVSVTDPSGVYASPVTAKVVLNAERMGSANFQLVQRGSLKLGAITGLDGTACLFDAQGNCVWTAPASRGASSGYLDADTYTLVLMEDTNLLQGVAQLSLLDAFGLTAERDYRKQTVTIRNGSITVSQATEILPLDPNKFGYLVDEETFVTLSKGTGLAPGELFTVCAAYKLNASKGAVAQSLKFVLPEGIVLSGDSVALLNYSPITYSYDEATRTVSVPVSGMNTAVLYLCCNAGSNAGTYSISAALTFENGALQSIGAVPATVLEATLSVPRKTASKTVTATGTTIPYAHVSLFVDNNDPILTTANAVGTWIVKFDLDADENTVSYHSVHARIDSELLPEPVYPEAKYIAYDSRFIEVESFQYWLVNKNSGSPNMIVGGNMEFILDSYKSPMPKILTIGSSGMFTTLGSYGVTFYFNVKIAGDTQPVDVYVKYRTIYGHIEYLKLTYNTTMGLWEGKKTFNQINAPVHFNVAYNLEEAHESPITDEMIDEYIDVMNDCNDVLAEGIDDFFESVHMTYDEERESLFMSYTDYNTKEEVTFAELTLDSTDLADPSLDALERDGYILEAGVDGIYPRITAEGHSMIYSFADVNEGTVWIHTMDYSPILGTPIQSRSGESLSDQPLVKIGNEIYDFWSDVVIDDELNDFGKATRDYISDFRSTIDNTKKGYDNIREFDAAQNWMCDEVDYAADELQELFDQCADNMSEEDRRNLQNMINAYRKRANDFKWRTNLGAIGVAAGNTVPFTAGIASIYLGARGFKGGSVARGLIKKLPGGRNVVAGYVEMHKLWHNTLKKYPKAKKVIDFMYKDPLGQYISGKGMDYMVEKVWDNWQKDNMNKLKNLYDNTMSDAESTRAMIQAAGSGYGSSGNGGNGGSGIVGLGCGDPMPKDDDGPGYNGPKYAIDPSGYVYEAVPSNRVEGVTASIYYKDENGQPVLWDATEYDQINNQITGTDGAYHWDVPVGEWKVMFTKEGYLPADTSGVPQANESGWLPVPPPQLDINVGIVSTAAPKVNLAVAYEGQLELQFSQYMNIDSVKNAVSLTRNGTAVAVQVAPMNAEYDLNEENQYATRFVVIPTDGNTSGQLILSVSADVKNYAGTPMGSAYSSEVLTALVKPTAISCPDELSIGQNEEYSFSVTLEPCMANQTLLVKNQLDFVVEVISTSVITDENGRAVITVKGLRDGESWIAITEPMSGLTKLVLVKTEGAVDEGIIQPVIATLEDGTVVTNNMILTAGTKVFLATQTEGADIRYTLNNTCPCKADALQYAGPIVLTDDTMLRAAAWKDGLYSATIKLNLNVRVPDCNQHTYSDWVAVDGKHHLHTCTVCGHAETAEHDYTIVGEILTQPALGVDGLQKFYCDCGEQILITLPQLGDVNEDGKVNMKDWNCMYEHLNEVSELPIYVLHCADVNCDEKVNMKDWNRLYEHLSETNPLE